MGQQTMPRILGVDIPNDKQAQIALTYIYGVGRKTATKVLESAAIDPTVRAKDLTEDELSRLSGMIENSFPVEGNLRRQVSQNISRLKDIACYRGLRHRRGLPARGQRTRTNARTRKGPKRTVSNKKKA